MFFTYDKFYNLKLFQYVCIDLYRMFHVEPCNTSTQTCTYIKVHKGTLKTYSIFYNLFCFIYVWITYRKKI